MTVANLPNECVAMVFDFSPVADRNEHATACKLWQSVKRMHNFRDTISLQPLLKVLSYLDYQDRANSFAASRYFRETCKDEKISALTYRAYIRHYYKIELAPCDEPIHGFWRDDYLHEKESQVSYKIARNFSNAIFSIVHLGVVIHLRDVGAGQIRDNPKISYLFNGVSVLIFMRNPSAFNVINIVSGIFASLYDSFSISSRGVSALVGVSSSLLATHSFQHFFVEKPLFKRILGTALGALTPLIATGGEFAPVMGGLLGGWMVTDIGTGSLLGRRFGPDPLIDKDPHLVRDIFYRRLSQAAALALFFSEMSSSHPPQSELTKICSIALGVLLTTTPRLCLPMPEVVSRIGLDDIELLHGVTFSRTLLFSSLLRLCTQPLEPFFTRRALKLSMGKFIHITPRHLKKNKAHCHKRLSEVGGSIVLQTAFRVASAYLSVYQWGKRNFGYLF